MAENHNGDHHHHDHIESVDSNADMIDDGNSSSSSSATNLTNTGVGSSSSSGGAAGGAITDDSGHNSLATDEAANEDIPEIELIIRASTIDGRRKGACLFCQEYFMDLYLLAELKTISLKVTTVDMLKPPPGFRSKFDSTPPPILLDNNVPILENDRIERYIMKNIPGGHNLFVSDKETSIVMENIYTKFKLMLTKNDDPSKNAFLNQLRKIDQHLQKRGSRYLTGDTLCCFDCELMTKLQHIRVAGKFFCEFEIPDEFEHLWRYMYFMYNLDAFKQSCPADQDIINHYKLQQRAKLTKHEELERPTYSASIPDWIVQKLEEAY